MSEKAYSSKIYTFLGLLYGILVIAIWYLIVLFVEVPLLDRIVMPLYQVPITEWLDRFVLLARIGLGLSALFWIFWYLFGSFVGVSDWRKANKRPHWVAPFFVLAIAAAVSAPFLLAAQTTDTVLASILLLLNNVFVYYIATLVASPPAYRHVPRFWLWRRS